MKNYKLQQGSPPSNNKLFNAQIVSLFSSLLLRDFSFNLQLNQLFDLPVTV
jgi:hypothetical protein